MSSTRVLQPIRTYTHNLSDRTSATTQIPYGCYKYESSKNYLPPGLFHFVRVPYSYVPTLHGLSADAIRDLKEVGVSTAASSMLSRPFLNFPELYPVELINTGHEPLRQGDRFQVQLPNRSDVDAQLRVKAELGYNASVNKAIWGGLLATRKVHCESCGDSVEEARQAIKREEDFDVFQLISPYAPQSILSMMTLIANGGDYHKVPEHIRREAARAVNEAYNPEVVEAILADENVRQYLRNTGKHVTNIYESVQGFASGQVIRACNGYNFNTIKTGDRFCATLNNNRWLS